jgi:hypothetical protein
MFIDWIYPVKVDDNKLEIGETVEQILKFPKEIRPRSPRNKGRPIADLERGPGFCVVMGTTENPLIVDFSDWFRSYWGRPNRNPWPLIDWYSIDE